MPNRQYTTEEAIENYLLTDIDVSFSTQVDEWIEQMTVYIESVTGKIFIAGATDTKKFEIVLNETDDIGKYTGSVVNLQIDDCVEVSKLKIDEEEVASTDYLLYPANAECKTRIKLTNDSGLEFTQGEQNISVEGKWGYSVTCPADIAFACMVLTAGIINNSLASEGEVKSVSMGSYNLTFKDEKQLSDFERVQEILNSYLNIQL